MITVKILTFLLIMCILNVIKEGISIAIAYKQEKPYNTSTLNNIMTMVSLSYIITIIICGF